MRDPLKGDIVFITDKESIYFRDWGRIEYIDSDVYGIAIADYRRSIPEFYRDQFRISIPTNNK